MPAVAERKALKTKAPAIVPESISDDTPVDPKTVVEPGVEQVARDYAIQQTLFNTIKKDQEGRKEILVHASGGVPNGKGGRIIAGVVCLTPDPKVSFDQEKANARFLEVAGVRTVRVLDADKLLKAVGTALSALSKHDAPIAGVLQDQIDTLLTYSRNVTEESLTAAVQLGHVTDEDAAAAFNITPGVKVTLVKAK